MTSCGGVVSAASSAVFVSATIEIFEDVSCCFESRFVNVNVYSVPAFKLVTVNVFVSFKQVFGSARLPAAGVIAIFTP